MYRIISPTKITKKRGEQTRRAVVAKVDFVISEQELFAYENGLYKPSSKKLPYLLKALNASFEEISEPVDLALA